MCIRDRGINTGFIPNNTNNIIGSIHYCPSGKRPIVISCDKIRHIKIGGISGTGFRRTANCYNRNVYYMEGYIFAPRSRTTKTNFSNSQCYVAGCTGKININWIICPIKWRSYSKLELIIGINMGALSAGAPMDK